MSKIHSVYLISFVIIPILLIGCNPQPKKITDVKHQTIPFKTMVYFEDSNVQKDAIRAAIDKQTVSLQLFQSTETPLSLFLALDADGVEDVSGLRRSLIEMIGRLPAESEVSVLSSNLGHESTNAFSKDQSLLAQLINSYKAEGRSTFFVSVLPLVRSASRFLQRSNRRTVAIYVTTKDLFFEDDEITKEAELIRQRIAEENATVPIFGIYLGEEKNDQVKRSAAGHVLEGTGGKCFFATKPGELQTIINQITKTFSGLYMVGFDVNPDLFHEGIHKIEISGGKLPGNFYSPIRVSQPAQNPIPETKSE